MQTTLIVVAGLPGVGKSFIADRIAERIDARILRTDEIRKEMAGIPQNEKRYEEFGDGIYDKEMGEKTYLEVIRRARDCLSGGRSCIMDATFSERKYRDLAFDLAGELEIPFLIVECTCPEEVVIERINSRMEGGKSISDATISIYQKMKDHFDKIEEDEIRVVVDTSGNVELMIEKLATYQRTIRKIPRDKGARDFFGVRA